MSKKENIREGEVYVLGSDGRDGKKGPSKKTRWIIAAAVLAIVAAVVLFAALSGGEEQTPPEYYFEPEDTAETTQSVTVDENDGQGAAGKGYIEVARDTVNGVALEIFTPHNLAMSLTVGIPETDDTDIVYAAMAADIRKDNEQIVGDFVLDGKQLARGVAKRGFCAVIDGTISIGVGTETPLLKRAVESGGCFFRQYPLVNNGEVVDNNPKNRSIRRALAVRDGRVIMAESKTRETFHDFSQALVDAGVSDAIYLVGGDAWGWYRDRERRRHEFGVELAEVPENISYIVWRAQK